MVASLGMLIVLEIAPEMNDLRRRHHVDVAVDAKEALAVLAAGVGAIEDAHSAFVQMRRTLQRHGSADMIVGRFDIGS